MNTNYIIILYTATPILFNEPYVKLIIIWSALIKYTNFTLIILRWGVLRSVKMIQFSYMNKRYQDEEKKKS